LEFFGLWLSLPDCSQMIGSAFDQTGSFIVVATMKLEEENKKKR
jgi:hypothetical protein